MSSTDSGWKTERLKSRVRFAYGDSLAAEDRNDGEISVFGSNGVVGTHDRAITEGSTIIIGRKGSFGKVAWSDDSCFPIDTTYFVDRRQTSQHLRWLYYTLGSLQLDTVNFDSAVPGLSREIAYALRVRFPPLAEQQRIAAFLDTICAAIDAAVSAKRKQHETLESVREALIESAVTQGLRQGVTMRTVNEDWITQIPAHWEVCRIKRVLSRVDYGISESTEPEGRFPVLKMGHIHQGELEFRDLDFVENVAADLLLETGDLLYNRTNSPDQVGKAAVFRRNLADAVTFASYLVRLRTNHSADPYFLNYVVNAKGFLSFARKLAIPSVQQSNLNSTRYCRIFIPHPPIDEQRDIAAHLDTKLAALGRVVAGIEAQIETLLVCRKSLIHEYVTGNRRVTTADLQRVQAND